MVLVSLSSYPKFITDKQIITQHNIQSHPPPLLIVNQLFLCSPFFSCLHISLDFYCSLLLMLSFIICCFDFLSLFLIIPLFFSSFLLFAFSSSLLIFISPFLLFLFLSLCDTDTGQPQTANVTY